MKTVTLLKSDLKNIFRDPSMVMILIVPFLITALLRFVPPMYEPYFPVMIAYRSLILGAFCLLLSALSGFLFAFVMLDEKDQHLFDVFRVMPFSFGKLVLFRVLSMFIAGFLFSIFLILGSGLVSLRVDQMLALAFLSAISGPANTLLIVSIAQNKIEGATYFKGLNMIIFAPLIGSVLLSPLRYLFGLIPFFWVFISFMKYEQPAICYLHIGAGIIINLLYLAGTYLLFLRKNK